MQRSVAAAVGLVTVAAMTGAAAQVGFAVEESAATMYTKRYVLKELASNDLDETTFAGSDRIRSNRTREVVGFGSYTGKFFPKTGEVVIHVGLALRGGVVVARVKSRGPGEEAFSGPILRGSGKYSGIDGTISYFGKRANIAVLKYRL